MLGLGTTSNISGSRIAPIHNLQEDTKCLIPKSLVFHHPGWRAGEKGALNSGWTGPVVSYSLTIGERNGTAGGKEGIHPPAGQKHKGSLSLSHSIFSFTLNISHSSLRDSVLSSLAINFIIAILNSIPDILLENIPSGSFLYCKFLFLVIFPREGRVSKWAEPKISTTTQEKCTPEKSKEVGSHHRKANKTQMKQKNIKVGVERL